MPAGKKKPRPRRGGTALDTPENKAKFLEVYAETCRVKDAAFAAGMASYRTVYEWRKRDPEFAAAWDSIKNEALADSIEDEIVRRGLHGIDEPVIYKGELCGAWVDKDGKEVSAGDETAVAFRPLTVRKYSDTCLLALANANIARYTRVRHELSGPGGGAIPVVDVTDHVEIARRVGFALAQGLQLARAQQGQLIEHERA